jgi:hypothetical protein
MGLSSRNKACIQFDSIINRVYTCGIGKRHANHLHVLRNHQMADWHLVMNGEDPFKIQPLQ